ncbi:MAG: hypothetical protein HKN39_08080 [Flavobacteriales bacterium]|nr:hypothetical protein [Flavobacteriales bacterium]
MKKIIYIIPILLIFSCTDLTDFREVENPNLSQESVVGQPNSSSIWLTGMERQLANLLNEAIVHSEIASDNYVNTQTFFNQFLDELFIINTDNDIEDFEFQLHRLREMGQFGLDEVGPKDPNYTAETRAEYEYFVGLANLFAGMYFTGLPSEPGGSPLSSEQNINASISRFNAAIGQNSLPEYHLALARAHYLIGDRADAVSAANDALGLSADFTRQADFDEFEGPSNTMEDALYERATFDDLQPLPTLDFLDPKYSFFTPDRDAPVHYLKAEEAMMIIIESLIAENDLGGAQTMMDDLLALVQSREVRNIDDSTEDRDDFDPGNRPDSSCVVVNGRSGLVLDRKDGNVDIPSISGTSLTSADISGITTDVEALYLLYRTRQEIFIAEGMRMVDMGVKLVISEVEMLQNDNVTGGSIGTSPQVPSFIGAVASQLDEISYVPGSCEASTAIDLNQILVDNRTDAMVLPFH